MRVSDAALCTVSFCSVEGKRNAFPTARSNPLSLRYSESSLEREA